MTGSNSRFRPEGDIRVSFVPMFNGSDSETPDRIDISDWIVEDDGIRYEYNAHPLTHILAEDPTPWEPFTMADGRTGKFRRLSNGDLQILVDAPGMYQPEEFRRMYLNDWRESVTEPQRVDETDEETGVVTTRWVLDDGTESEFGPVELKLRQEIGELKLAGQLSGTLVSAAYALARKLDRDAGMATAAVARELREYVKMIEGVAGDSEDTKSHRDDLSTPV